MVGTSDAVLLFDGGCAFCSRGVHFVYRRDPKGRFRFATLESETGRALVARHGLEGIDSVVLVADGRAWVRSGAVLRAGRRLRWPWSWLAALGFLVPRRLRDAAYDAFARRRHRLLKGAACPVPPPGLRARIVE